VGFVEERELAERALVVGDRDDDEEPEFPPAAKRFEQAREGLGLTQADVAERWHQPVSMYWDLEFHDSEAFDVISVRDLMCLADILQVSVFHLLFGGEPPAPIPMVSYEEVVRRLRQKMEEKGMSVDEMSDAVGIELREYLEDSERMAELPISGLRWICRAVDVEWVEVLSGGG
jgi:transcriptional regulator with XRE-family HTH domain